MRYLLIPLLLGCLVLSGCDGNRPSSNTPVTFTSGDGTVTVTTPGDWSKQDIHDEGDLELGNASEDCFFLLLSESRLDYAGTLEEHSDDTRSMLLSGATNVKETGPRQMTINGQPAIQYTITATLDRLNLVYLHTTIQTPDKLHQIVAWTTASRYKQYEPMMQSIIASLVDSSETPDAPQ